MPVIDLTVEQTSILREYLRRDLSDLSVEIAGTDKKDYREEIKAERRILEEVVEKLGRIDK